MVQNGLKKILPQYPRFQEISILCSTQQNGQKYPKMSEMVTQMAKTRPGIPRPKSLTKNSEILMKY